MIRRHALPFALFFLIFAWRAGNARIGEGWIDPVGRIAAQDEAVYSHAALRMAEAGDWATPFFLDRFFLYKPPLVYWTSGLSAKLAGVGAFQLRLPAILAATLICLLVLHAGGWPAAVATATSLLFFILARRNMTDMLLCLCIVAVYALVKIDPRLERTTTAFLLSMAIGAAVLAKSTGAVIPAAILVAAAAVHRIPVRRVTSVFALATAVALPWFILQYHLHPRWFWSEFVEVELLAWSSSAAPQTTAESAPVFYLKRLWSTDWLLCIAAAAGLWRRPDPVLPAWIVISGGAVAAYGYHNATYLLPLIPALAILGFARIPAFAAIALAVFRLPGLYQPPEPLPTAALIEQRCERGRTNDLILVQTADEFYAPVLPMPRVRYAFPGTGQPPPGYSLDFRSLGVALSTEEFLDFDATRAKYGPRLREWGLPDDRALGTVIAYPTNGHLTRLIQDSPGADFIIRREDSQIVQNAPHEILRDAAGNLLLLSRTAADGPKPSRPCRL